MAFSQTNIGRVRLGKQSAWNTATASPAFSDLHIVEAEVFIPELATEILQTESMRGNYAAYRSVSGGKSNISVSIKMPMHGWSAGAGGSPTASNQHVDALLLEYARPTLRWSAARLTAALARRRVPPSRRPRPRARARLSSFRSARPPTASAGRRTPRATFAPGRANCQARLMHPRPARDRSFST